MECLDLGSEVLVQVFGSLHQLNCLLVDLALDVELIAFDRNQGLLCALRDNQAHLGQVRSYLVHSLVNLIDIMLLAECIQVVSFLEQSGLHLEDVQ